MSAQGLSSGLGVAGRGSARLLGCGGFRRAYAGAARFLVTMEGVEATPSLRTAPPCHQPPRMRRLVFLGQWGPGVLVAG